MPWPSARSPRTCSSAAWPPHRRSRRSARGMRATRAAESSSSTPRGAVSSTRPGRIRARLLHPPRDPDCSGRNRRHWLSSLEHARHRPALRRGPRRLERCRPRRRANHVSDGRGQRAHPPLLADPRRDRRRRPRRRGCARLRLRALDHAAAQTDRVRRRGSRRGNLAARAPLDGPPELQQLAREFNDMVVKLDALLRSQDEFVADASHQLRTPLTALRLRLENLAREDVTRSDELEPAIVEVERLSSLVDGLLTLARADRATSEPIALDAGAAIAERVEAWSALASEQAVQLSAQVEGRPFAAVTAGRIEQVLDNLLANALEVSPAGSSVDVAAARSGVGRDRGPRSRPGNDGRRDRPRVRPLLALGRRRRGLRSRAHDRPSARASGWGRGRAPPAARRRARGDRPASASRVAVLSVNARDWDTTQPGADQAAHDPLERLYYAT